jgi:hypothetical protein
MGESKRPGLKPLFVAGLLRGLKPPANPVKQTTARAKEEADSQRE